MNEKNIISRLAEKRYIRFFLLAISGVLTGLTLIFPKIGFFEWLSLVPAGVFLYTAISDRKYRLRSLYGYGFFFFMCFGCTIFHWFANLYPLDFVDGMTKGAAMAVVLAGCVGLSLLQALFGGLLFVAFGVLCRGRVGERFPNLRPLFVASLWAIYEWTQTHGWIGVPWGRLALGQTEYVLGIQTASLFGPYFISFCIVLVNMSLAYVLMYADRRKTALCMAAGVLVFQYGMGSILYFTYKPSDRTVTVAAVQGNVSSNEKWSSNSAQRTSVTYSKYTYEAAEKGADIVVYPETAFPYKIDENSTTGLLLSSIAQGAEVTVLAGGFLAGEEGGEYNAVVCFTPDGKIHDTAYLKRHLVPFGENVPMRGFFEVVIPPLAELVMVEDDVLEGKEANIIKLPEGNIGSLICFDSIYETLAIDSVREGAELICLSTNDSWFTDSAALDMHNAQAKLRAVENGRYLVRAANTGLTTIINPKGEVEVGMEPLIDGYIIGEVELHEGRTLYNIIGNTFVYALIIACATLVACDFILKLIENRKQRGI